MGMGTTQSICKLDIYIYLLTCLEMITPRGGLRVEPRNGLSCNNIPFALRAFKILYRNTVCVIVFLISLDWTGSVVVQNTCLNIWRSNCGKIKGMLDLKGQERTSFFEMVFSHCIFYPAQTHLWSQLMGRWSSRLLCIAGA